MGAINNLVPFSLLLWSQTRIASSLASILNATTPVFTVLLAHLLTRDERMTPGRVGGVIAGLAGVVVMIGPEALRGFGDDLTAELIALGAPISYAFAGIYGRGFRADPPLVTAAGQVTATTLMILPIAVVVDRPWERASVMPATLGALVGLALLSTALASVIFFRILATAGATNLLLVTLLIPASAMLLGMSVLGEQLAVVDFAGMGLIGLGLALIDGRPVASLGRLFRDGRRKPVSFRETPR
jgi:drug/metabolite transporter (DMT)-like permease